MPRTGANMSGIIATKAEQGVQQLVDEAERTLQLMVAQQRPGATFSFLNSVYYLPIILGSSSKAAERLGDLRPVLSQARRLLQAAGQGVNTARNAGQAALLAAEVIEALHSPDGQFDSRISDTQVRSWGVQLADGRMAGVALLIGRAVNNAVAVKLVEGLRQRHILCLLGGSCNGGGLWQQLEEEGIKLGSQHYILPLGKEPTSAVHALGFLARCAMKLGGNKPGMWPEILTYCRQRAPGFTLGLGELDDRDYALAQGASEMGFPLITDTAAPSAAPGLEPEQFFPMPFESIAGKDDMERAVRLVEKCIAARGLKPKIFKVSIPVPYGPAFEEEQISDAELQVEYGGGNCAAFQFLQKAPPAEVSDGKVEVIGPEPVSTGQAVHMGLAMIIKVAGERIKPEFEPYLERQMQVFMNYAAGVQHAGQQDRVSVRISREAAEKGVTLQSLGNMLCTRFHEQFGSSVQSVQVTLITEPKLHAEWLEKARAAYEVRRKRIAGLTDDQVDVFFSCTHCRAFAPNNVSVITPEHISPCGKCDWFDAIASFELDPAAGRRPLKPGKLIDGKRGIWEGTNQYAKVASRGRMSEIALYSLMQTPMGACGDFECMVMLIPEANGVMVLSHEDATLPTPAGITIETFSSLTAGEQIPGMVGIGKNLLLSPKFMFPEGGFRRVVWMSSRLKDSMREELQVVCEREGDPSLMDRIADERQVTTSEQLVNWLKEHQHPAMQMEKMY